MTNEEKKPQVAEVSGPEPPAPPPPHPKSGSGSKKKGRSKRRWAPFENQAGAESGYLSKA